MRIHVTILGWLQILLGLLDVLLGLVVIGVLAGTSFLLGPEGGPAFSLWGGAAATIIGSIVLLTALAVYTFWALTGDEARRWFAGP